MKDENMNVSCNSIPSVSTVLFRQAFSSRAQGVEARTWAGRFWKLGLSFQVYCCVTGGK